MPDQLTLTEALGNLGDVQQGPAKGRKFRALLIKAGWGSSGYYSEEVLKRDGPKAWPAGTQSYLDHPSVTENMDRPERSVRDLASTIITDPVWDSALGGLVAEVEVFPQWASLLNEDFAKKVGLSIRAYGTAEQGEAEGRSGSVITSLDEGISVDWVTRAGAGGRVLELIESARNAKPGGRPKEMREGRNIGHYMESRIHSHFSGLADGMFGEGRLTRPERIGLSNAIGDGLKSFTARTTADHPQLYERDLWEEPPADAAVAESARRRLREGHGLTANELSSAISDAVRENYGGDKIYTWVRDYTDEWVVFTVEDSSDCDLYQQNYTVDEQTQEVTLTGEPVEVVARTTYVPAPADPDELDDPNEPAAAGDPLAEDNPKNAPGTPPADPKKIKEGGMPEITEEQARQLAEAAETRNLLDEATKRLTDTTALLESTGGRVTELETKLAEADSRNARLENDRQARAQVGEALKGSGLPEFTHARVTESVCRALPAVEGGALDTIKLAEAITVAIDEEKSYVASLAEATGAGLPRGLGDVAADVSDADIEKQLAEAFEGLGMDAQSASTAAHGRG